MTGLSTDIGINLTKIFAWRGDREKFSAELRTNLVRLGILSFFIFGGSMALVIFSKNGYYGFIFPFVSSLCILTVSILSEMKVEERTSSSLVWAKNSIWGTFILTIVLGFYQLAN